MDLLNDPSLYSIKAIAILDNDGNRILAKWYDGGGGVDSVKEQKAFEKNLFNKTKKANAEIIMLDGLICVYRSNVDLFFYVIGNGNENELILVSVLNCLYETVSLILRKNVEKRALFDNLDAVMLAVDEICDGGVIMECEPTSVYQRVALRSGEEMGTLFSGDQTVAQVGMQVIQSAKEQLKWSLLK